MNIKKIVKNMQEFQEEMHLEFKDSKTFWKHFYIKLDKEIYKEFQNLVQGEDTEDKDYKKEVRDLLREVFKSIDTCDIDIIEVELKEKTT